MTPIVNGMEEDENEREIPEAPGKKTYAGAVGGGAGPVPPRIKFSHERRKWTTAITVSTIRINGRRPSFKDMLRFIKDVLKVDINRDVQYVNLHTLQPLNVFYRVQK